MIVSNIGSVEAYLQGKIAATRSLIVEGDKLSSDLMSNSILSIIFIISRSSKA